MKIKKEQILNLVKNLEFEEAVSHRLHSRIFEVLGYLSMIDKTNLPSEVSASLDSIEELNKKLLEEIHLIIEYYTAKKHSEF
ncbi:MAG: hypothetical protein R6W90_04690 [Ignavibacteriaceae bacterium]